MAQPFSALPRDIIQRRPRESAAVVALTLCAFLLFAALWSLSDGAAPAHGLDHVDDDPDKVRSRALDIPLGATPAAAVRRVEPHPNFSLKFKSFSTSVDHACGILLDDTIACWGSDRHKGGTPPVGTFKAVDTGWRHNCAIRTDDTVACWGEGVAGTPSDETFRSVSAGQVSCGIKMNGTAHCWSAGGSYEIEHGGSFETISVGHWHICAVRVGGTVACWGENNYGQATPPDGTFTSVSAGDLQTCGVRTDGTLACWGANWHGRSTPPEGKFQSVSTLWDHSCGLRTDGTAKCWGHDIVGQSTPPDGTFRSVGAGGWYSCGHKFDYTLVCWGDNSHDAHLPPAGGTNNVPPVTNITVCSGPDAGEVVVSWDGVLSATHYRIGYVNMVQDYPRAKASVTGEWIEAFIYVDVNARNLTVSEEGRAQYVLRRLVNGDRHAFTVLSSKDVVNTSEILSGEYRWPQNPRWKYLTVADPPEPDCR